jgi:hypothetical protein
MVSSRPTPDPQGETSERLLLLQAVSNKKNWLNDRSGDSGKDIWCGSMISFLHTVFSTSIFPVADHMPQQLAGIENMNNPKCGSFIR